MSAKHHKHLASAFDLFGQSYEIVMRNIKNFAILMALPLLAAISSTISNSDRASESTITQLNVFNGTAPAFSIISAVVVGALLFFVVAAVIALIVQTMLYGLQLEGAQGKTPGLGHLWQIGKKHWLRLFGLSLMVGLYLIGLSLFGVIIMVFFRHNIGFLLGLAWFIAAVGFVIQRYFLSPYVLIDQGLPVLDSLEKSAQIAKNHGGYIWSVIGVMVLLAFTGIVPVIGPLVSFILGAFYSVAPALRYEELKRL